MGNAGPRGSGDLDIIANENLLDHGCHGLVATVVGVALVALPGLRGRAVVAAPCLVERVECAVRLRPPVAEALRGLRDWRSGPALVSLVASA